MELVEDDEPDAGKGGVGLEPAGEDALGGDLDAGRGADPALITGLVADQVTDGGAREGGPYGGQRRASPTSAARA